MTPNEHNTVFTIEKLLQYNVSVYLVNGIPQQVPSNPLTNGFIVKNSGNSIVNVEGDLLYPGEAKSVGGNRGELFVGKINVKFQAQAVQPTPRVDQATITEKFYTNIPMNVNNPSIK